MTKTATRASHLAAATISLLYAWQISQTQYVTTGLQFVTPLLLMIAIHTLVLGMFGGLKPGFAQQVFARTFGTAMAMVGAFFLISIVAPKPAIASNNKIETFLTVVFCLVILLILVVLTSAIIFVVFRLLRGIWRMLRSGSDSGSETRLFDFASVGITALVLVGASLEGLPNQYSFDTKVTATATQMINATPAQVWQTMEQATSPQFPLPGILAAFPKPVAVDIDEGTTLGAKRRVQFEGREGAGALSLEVTNRTTDKAIFSVLSDTSPFASWIGFNTLTYGVTANGNQTQLDVSLRFDRRLAPAWFFAPLMKGAASLAMGVLARDVKLRSEQVDG